MRAVRGHLDNPLPLFADAVLKHHETHDSHLLAFWDNLTCKLLTLSSPLLCCSPWLFSSPDPDQDGCRQEQGKIKSKRTGSDDAPRKGVWMCDHMWRLPSSFCLISFPFLKGNCVVVRPKFMVSTVKLQLRADGSPYCKLVFVLFSHPHGPFLFGSLFANTETGQEGQGQEAG
jgi:hypothetical protein